MVEQVDTNPTNRVARKTRKPSRSQLRQLRREQLRLEWQQLLEKYPQAEAEAILRGYRRKNIIKWMLGLTGFGLVLFTALMLLLLIVVPVWYRGLEPAEQDAWGNRIPALRGFKPTRAYSLDVLPTVESNNSDAMSLLQTPVNTVAADGSSFNWGGGQAVLPSNPTDKPVPTATFQFTATRTPPPGPTSILATVTPVIGFVVTTTPTPHPMVVAPQPSPTAIPTNPPPPVPTTIPAPPLAQLSGYKFVQQGWNECGPANLTQALHFLGWAGTLEQVVKSLKGSREDRNVSPWEMVNFVDDTLNRDQGIPVRALMRVGGSFDLIKRLVANRFAVVLEKGYVLAEEGWMGHYLTIQGYDDSKAQFHTLDTYLGDRWEDYDKLDERWQQFNRTFVVLYPEERERELSILLGPFGDTAYSVTTALVTARQEASSRPDNQYAWFNLGTNYTLLKDYANAVKAYNKSQSLGGWQFRMLWYQFGPYEAYYMTGDYANVISLADVTLKTSPYLEESDYWRGMAMAATGQKDEAIASFKRALSLRSSYKEAADALQQVQDGTFQPPK